MCYQMFHHYQILRQMKKIRKGINKVMSKISDFATTANAALKQANDSLDNIVSDEANLSKQIADLVAQIAASGSVLTPEDQTALDNVASTATALAARTKVAADAVPDLPPMPPPVG